MSDKIYTVHVDGNRQYSSVDLKEEIQPDQFTNVGQFADAVARTFEVVGDEFSFKADGEVVERGMKIGKLTDGAFLELIEVTIPTEPAPPAETVELTEVGPVDGTVAEVLDGVGDDKELAAAALTAELEKGNDARVTLIEGLEAILAEPPVE